MLAPRASCQPTRRAASAGASSANLTLCFASFGDAHSGVASTTLMLGAAAYGAQLAAAPVTVAALSNRLPAAPAPL